jgi:hypothetical protein
MTSHDVRKLKTCCLCQGVGIYRPLNPSIGWPLVLCLHSAVVPLRDRKYAHPSCYLEEMGISKLLTLSMSELGYVRMCDVPLKAMSAILKHSAGRP